jgi:hypothetical protein
LVLSKLTAEQKRREEGEHTTERKENPSLNPGGMRTIL